MYLFILFSPHLDAYHIWLRERMQRLGTVSYNRETGGWHRLISVANGSCLPEVHYDLGESWLTRDAAVLELIQRKTRRCFIAAESRGGVLYEAVTILTQPVMLPEVPTREPVPLLKVLPRRSGNVVFSSATTPSQAEPLRRKIVLLRRRLGARR